MSTTVAGPKTYTKRIYAARTTRGSRVSLCVTVLDSVASGYFITVDALRVAEYQRKEAALERVRRIQAGEDDVAAPVRIEDLALVAADVVAGRVASPVPPTLELLCAVTMALLKGKGRSDRHASWYETVARACGKQVIPTEKQEFVQWVDAMCVRLAEGVVKRSTLDLRLKLFSQVLRTALVFPAVFPGLDVVVGVQDRVRAKRSVLEAGRGRIESRACMTAKEVLGALGECRTLEEKMFFVLCLATGLRAGEAERLRVSHLTHDGCVDLSRVQTKTQTKRTPKAPVVVRAILKTFDPPWPRLDVQGLDRRRFRPTCATLLGLAGIPALRVCERLGHANSTMVEKHYSKAPPPDMAGRGVEEYLDAGELTVGGVRVEENAFDRWCLLLALTAVSGSARADAFKGRVVEEITGTSGAKPTARAF